MQIEEALRVLGLEAKEALIYMSLLELGQASGYAIAERSGLKRPTVYVVLDSLRRKGLTLKVPHPKKQLFIAKSPEDFFSEEEVKFKAAQSVLPQLLAMAEKPGRHFKTLYFEGVRGMHQMLQIVNERMKGKEILGFYAKEPENTPKEVLEYFHEFNEERKKLNIRVRGMTPDHPSVRWYKERVEYFGNQFKFLNREEYFSDSSIEIGDGFIQIFSLRFFQGVHIENPDIANQLRQIFEMVWKSRPEPVQGKTE